MAEAIVSSTTPSIFERCVRAGAEHLGYIWNYKKNIANLQTQVQRLDEERADKRHSVTVAVKNAHKIKNRVKGWQDGADKISDEAIQIIKDYEEKGKKRCLMGSCPNLVSRYQFSKRACKKDTEIVNAMSEAGGIGEVSDRAIGLGKDIALSTEGCFTFESRKSILEDIMKTLQDETNNSIGVYGLGGMGKTTLAKQVASQVTKENMFEEVVMASVTQKVDTKEIQGQIASMLDLRLEESSVAERAGRIQERLNGKKVLVILDDLWTKLDLIQVGIPFGAEHMGCKVLLTSRFLPVLTTMGTRKEFVLGALMEDEAWRLFEEKVIHIVENPTFLTIGKKIAKRCAGLPILIVTVAASLAKRPDLDAWNDALAQIKKMNNKNMHDIVNSAIESISYDCLEETHKQLFLLCGLMQGKVNTGDLLKYILGWDIFCEGAVTVEGARNRMQALIFDLKEFCLLLDGDASDFIIMHDVVRDVAISIARKDLNAFSAGDNDTDLSRWPKNDVLKKCTAMVFKECRKLPCFPERLECPSLELFILDAFLMDSKSTIPDTFFERTSKLKVLNMSALCFPTLPSSLYFLKNLQSLHLDHCDGLQDISMVGELKKLQVLSLVHSTIQELPSSLGQLSELKLLDLNRCSQLKVIPVGLIASLSQLEELHMRKSFNRWKVEECFSNNSGRSNASFAELKCLPNLSSLKVQLRDANLLAEDLNFENWKRYEIIIGDMWGRSFRKWFKSLGSITIIALEFGTDGINHLQHVVNKLFNRTEVLCLGELKCTNNVIPELNGDGFPNLKHLRIKEDYDIQYIVNVEDKEHNASFPVLESLYLSGMRKVEKICNAQLMESSFYNLTILKVQHCDSMESLFSFSTITVLPCLQEIRVSSCNVLEEIIVKNRREDDDGVNNTCDGHREKIKLAKLHKLALHYLPKFMTFFNDKKIPMVKRRQKLLTSEMESEDESISSLSIFEEVSFPKLEELELCGMSNLTEIWSHKHSEVACCNLTKLTVSRCDNLKYLFTSSHTRVLVGLQRLTIRECPKMKQVVAGEEGETKTETIIFPQLSFIKLDNLPNLTTFYSGFVEEITTRERIETVTQPLFDEKVQLPSLKTLFIKKLDSIRAIWSSTVGIMQSIKKDSFCKLESVKDKPQEIPIFQNLSEVMINKCDSLKFVFPASVARSLKQLMKVCVEDCGVETIIGDDEDIEFEKLEAGTITFTLPNLESIELKGLPKMECFYSREHTIEWPALKVLAVVDCDKFHDLDFLGSSGKQGNDQIVKVPGSMSFKNLLEMEITSCAGMKYLFTPSIAMGLDRVRVLTIAKCSKMKAIVCNEGGEATIDRIAFPQLIYLSLEDLPNLTRFYSKFEEMDSDEKLDSNVQPLFTEKIQFPRLKNLNVGRLDNINTIWQSQQLYGMDSFCELEGVAVTSCASLLKIFPSTMWTPTKNNLKDESQEILIFQNLSEVTVYGCKSLNYVFPASMARLLNQLKTICIEDCGVETIVGDDEDEEFKKMEEGKDQVTTTFTFSKLTSVGLYNLPKMECFYSREHTINWPTLDKLIVMDCGEFSVLDFFEFTGKQGNNQIIKVISSLKSLSIRSKELSTLLGLCDLFLPRLSLKELTINEIHSELFTFPSKFLNIIHHQLQTFRVYDCSFQEVFPYEGDVIDFVNDGVLFPQLRNLVLMNMPELEYICKQDPYSSFILNILDRLEDLDVMGCPRLTNLVPPSVSFRLLKELQISNCGGLINLLRPSTARSLEQLEMLSISGCEMIKEIIGTEVRDDDEESSSSCREDEIIFNNLHYLKFQELPKLTNFCSSRNYTFNFPKLELVYVIKCPIMKTFCGGITTLPDLNEVFLMDFYSEGRWEGELNTTLEKIYEEREAERLATALPSILATNHHEAQAQEERMAGTYTCEKSKGKEVEVSEQSVKHFEKSETPQYSDASCSNYTTSSSQLCPQSSNHPDEVSHLATQVEAHTATVSTTSSSNQFETQTQIHEICTVEREKESQILRNYIERLENKESEICENVTKGPRKEIETRDQVVEMEAQGLTITLPSTSSSGQFEQETESHEKSTEGFTEPTKEGQISKHDIDKLGNETEVSEKTTKLRNESELCDNANEPKQVSKISLGLVTKAETENFIPLIRESFRALGDQQMSSLNAEQVHFVKNASDWLCAYAKKATKCLERNDEIYDLQREIDEKESKVRALQDENEATSSSMPSFG